MASMTIYPLTSYQACRLLAYAGFADLDPRTHARKFRVAVYIAKILDAADEKMELMSTLSLGQDGAPIMATISKQTEGGDVSVIIDIDAGKAHRWLRKQKIEPVAGADFGKMEDKPMNDLPSRLR